MRNLSSETDWFEQQPMHPSMRLSACICVCASEDLIQTQEEPERMRAFLLVAVFLEQCFRSHFENLHEAFCLDFAVPQLLARGGHGCASPDWLLNHQRGFDQNLDWQRISELATGASEEVYAWLHQRDSITMAQFQSLLHRDIASTFDLRHQPQLQQAFTLPEFTIMQRKPPVLAVVASDPKRQRPAVAG